MNFRGANWREKRNIPIGPMHYTIAKYSTNCRIDQKTEMKAPIFDEEILNRFRSISDPLKKNLADSIPANITHSNMSPNPTDYYYEDDIAVKSMDNAHGNVYSSLTGITNFFSNFFGAISGAVFHKRAKSPVSQYYDCFDDSPVAPEMASSWQPSKLDQNKIGAPDSTSIVSNDNMNDCRAAFAHCESKLDVVRTLLTTKAVQQPKLRLRRPKRVFVDPASVEDCLEDAFPPSDTVSFSDDEYVEYYTIPNNQVAEFCQAEALKTKTEMGPESTEIVQVLPAISEPHVLEEIPNKQTVIEIKAVSMKNEMVPEIVDIVKVIHETVDVKPECLDSISNTDPKLDINPEIITSCEDKIAKLKSLLENHKKTVRTTENTMDIVAEPIPEKRVTDKPPKIPTRSLSTEKIHDKRFKNQHRLNCTKRKHSKLHKAIEEDMKFANEIDNQELSSESSPVSSPITKSVLNAKTASKSIPVRTSVSDERNDYFDELKGRFHPSSTDSDDSFQIVFTDSPKVTRNRQQSDCESEDSFIVFEDSPDSCYISNDVFGEPTSGSESESSDAESDFSDSGEDFKISQSLSRTMSDLTDESLYKTPEVKLGDEVDCAVKIGFEKIPDVEMKLQDSKVTECKDSNSSECEDKDSPITGTDSQVALTKAGLLLDEKKKRQRKDLPAKKVSFCADPPKVHVMRVWAFASRQARAGHWERHSLDRERFKRRIADVDMAVSWVLKPQHRSRVMFQRFMPWWNAQRRKEIAERKAEEVRRKKEEEEERRLAEEKRKEEEEARKMEEEKKIELGKSKAEAFLQPLREKMMAKKLELERRKEEIRIKSERDAMIEQRMQKKQLSSRVGELVKDRFYDNLDTNVGNDKISDSMAEAKNLKDT